MSRLSILIVVAVAMMLRLAPAGDREWGHLSGRFVYGGDPPPVKKVQVTKDNLSFGDTIHDESLSVNKKDRGIANVVVYLLPRREQELHVHASYARTAKAKVELTMQGGKFVPHVLLIRTSQTMVQRNLDKVGHNARIQFFHNAPR